MNIRQVESVLWPAAGFRHSSNVLDPRGFRRSSISDVCLARVLSYKLYVGPTYAVLLFILSNHAAALDGRWED